MEVDKEGTTRADEGSGTAAAPRNRAPPPARKRRGLVPAAMAAEDFEEP